MPYAALLRYAVLQLGIRPQDFWRMTYQEWAMLIEQDEASAPTRKEIQEMVKAWEDNARMAPSPSGRRMG